MIVNNEEVIYEDIINIPNCSERYRRSSCKLFEEKVKTWHF